MLIGIDVGTTAVKAALFDPGGHAQKTFAARYPTHRPAPGQVEQEPADWMGLVLRALSELGADRKDVLAIGLCSQVNTHVFVDGAGKALIPAMTWQDVRSAPQAMELDAQITAADKLDWWGAPLPVDASHVLARMVHVKRQAPAVWEQTRWVLAPKDYCLLHLTGEVVADPMTNFGIVDGKLRPIERLVSLVDGARERLPPLASFTHVAGRIRAGLPCAGVPMVTGAMDAWAGLLGSGVSKNGEALYLSGTSEILGIISNKKAPVPGVIAFPEYEGIVWHAGPTQSGGASMEWLSRLLSRTPQELSDLARHADLSKPLPLFLPHLEGERAPLWDPVSRGALTGLSSSAGASEITRAVMEGVGYSARLVFQSLEASACLVPQVIRHSGGGSASDIWCQVRADILQKPLQRTATRDAGVLGAAMMAGVGVGLFPSLQEAAADFVVLDRTFEPDTSEHGRHEERFKLYQSLYTQLKPINASLR
jgi:xylulokinase